MGLDLSRNGTTPIRSAFSLLFPSNLCKPFYSFAGMLE